MMIVSATRTLTAPPAGSFYPLIARYAARYLESGVGVVSGLSAREALSEELRPSDSP
jgi:hypothetical protein